MFPFLPEKSRRNYFSFAGFNAKTSTGILSVHGPLITVCTTASSSVLCGPWKIFLLFTSNYGSSAEESFHCMISHWQLSFLCFSQCWFVWSKWFPLAENTIHEKNFLVKRIVDFSAEYQQRKEKHNCMRIRNLHLWLTSSSNQSKDGIRVNPLKPLLRCQGSW